MSKKSIKIISTLLTIAIVLMMLTSVAFATTTPSSLTQGGKDLSGDKFTNMGKNIISTISTVAMIVAVIVLMVLGIKYMMGSAEEKASYKKTMMPYLVGAVLVFGAGAVADVVFNFATGLNG